MDILTHTISGLAVASVVSSFSSSCLLQKSKILILGGFASALPDIDAISLWSQFDATFGSWFNLEHTGNEIYYSKFWYSHHGFFHSLFACLMFSFILACTIYIIKTNLHDIKLLSLIRSIKSNKLYIVAFLLGYWIHLLEDMPTPGSVWGGVNLFWPLKTYTGGAGNIWWWNNYDLFLIALGVLIINLLLTVIYRRKSFFLRKIVLGVFILGFSFSVIQIKTRDFNFSYTGHTTNYTDFELKSKEVQKEILGPNLFQIMMKFDNSLGVYF